MTSKMNKIKLTSMINPHFYKLWRTKKPYIIAKGGRGSFKSSTISLKLVTMMKKHIQQNHKVNVVIVRENTNNLRDSVYAQIGWALDMLHMTDDFTFNVSPMKITHNRTKSSFYFYGGDKPEKLKSNTVRDVIALWYEEAANFKSAEVFDQTNPTFIRQKSPYVDQVDVFYSYNPPKNPYSWINEWVDSLAGDPDYLVDHSTYLDDKLNITTKQQLELIEKYKKNDYDYYRYLYLGEVIGLGTNVYNLDLFKPIDELPDDDRIVGLAYAVDAGHQQSATTCLCLAVTARGDVILIDTYYYSPAGRSLKKAPSELSKDINAFVLRTSKQFKHVPIINRTIDSAEGALRNQYMADFGIRWNPVNKLKEADMVDFVQDLLAQGRFSYLDNEDNQIFISEHKQYQWDEKTVNSDNPKVIKENDHTVDALKYFAIDNARLLKLTATRKVV
ncbi:PBSX family phage terminase large subunit [Lapidilactobacillus mulanensis]|uniref:PBSX family phage terminase large subunit n=1 Tax=Lapidilactobacillus mulanensis TaxID=2485999 RepID=A0ABW4DQX0_9LACO|nr:PBSX family phage terminase large subunit [Lapidilactobacillus mulanensis]